MNSHLPVTQSLSIDNDLDNTPSELTKTFMDAQLAFRKSKHGQIEKRKQARYRKGFKNGTGGENG